VPLTVTLTVLVLLTWRQTLESLVTSRALAFDGPRALALDSSSLDCIR
jgi:hypothetical protein